MRYRPFGTSGAAVSALSLVLTDQPMRADDRVRLIYAALESGINTFELQSRDPVVMDALGDALQVVERPMVFVALRVGWDRDRHGGRTRNLSAEALTGSVDAALASSGLGWIDVLLLDVQDSERLPEHVIPTLQAAQAARKVRMLGIAGGDGVDPYLESRAFQVLATSFSILSGWRERNRLKRAVQADMPIMGCDYQPFAPTAAEEDRPAGPLGLRKLLAGRKERPEGAYAFLERIPNWSAEEICLGYALTEPSLTTVQTRVRLAEALEDLAAVVDRDLPTGLAAQIEMARFSALEASGAA